jgi:hypothetical protein
MEPTAIINTGRLYTSCVNEYVLAAESVDIILILFNTEFGRSPLFYIALHDVKSPSTYHIYVDRCARASTVHTRLGTGEQYINE